MQKIRVGLIGFGLSGKTFHAPFLKAHEGYEVVRVSTSRAAEVAAFFPRAEVVGEARAIIEAKDVDLVINTAPNEFHFSYSAESLEAGKHVVVEKPFVISSADGARLIEIANRVGKKLSVFHNRRWDSDFLTVKKLMAGGELGEIKQFESHMDRWRPNVRAERWREQAHAGSGVFFDLGPHLIDQAVELFGAPERVTGDITNQKDGAPVDDYFHVILHYGNRRVILHSSSFAPKTARFQIFGTRGSFSKFGLDPQEDQLKAGVSPTDPSFGAEKPVTFGEWIDPDKHQTRTVTSEKGTYAQFYDQLHKAIAGAGALPVTADQALTTIRLIELALESSKLRATLDFRP